MCGFSGIIDFAGRPVEPGAVTRMRRCLHHRGPDNQQDSLVGATNSPFSVGSGLGFCRLAILDLSPLGNQPMTSACGTVTVVFNGEIYNHHELRQAAVREGLSFRSRSDTEVLVELLARHWADAVPRLRGMFAFAAVNRANGRVLLARDRVGKKPLYYRIDNGRLAFASELKALLADPETSREIDPLALHFYLAYQYVPSPHTILRGVSKVQPGHIVECDASGCLAERYWSPSVSPKCRVSFRDAVKSVRHLVEEAVRLRLESDVPLGAFLSGGVDSSVVTFVMAKLSPQRLNTFSIGFRSEAYDERRFAKLIAETFGTVHRELIVHLDALAELPLLARAYDEPFGDSSALPTFHLARLTRQHVTVALSGDGGDEVFGGYERYAANVLAGRLTPLARADVLRDLGDRYLLRGTAAPRSRRRSLQRLWEGVRTENPGARYAGWMRGLPVTLLRRLYPTGARSEACVDRYLLDSYYDADGGQTSEWDRMQRLDILTYLPEDLLVKVDRASMANSLEVRAPLLDHHLIDYVLRLPAEIRNPRGRLKALLKAAFPEIPRGILRRRKAGFGVPVADWFRRELGQHYAAMVLAADSRSATWFDKPTLVGLLEQHRSRVADNSVALWTLLMFEHWHRAHLH
jgi:asparagine synthase (glutamine-hydrolysing)